MDARKSLLSARNLGLLALLLLFFRITYPYVTGLGLFFDEAYYHYWSNFPDWGYYSKPPMIAWLIYATTHLFGSDAEWAVRISSPLLYAASAWCIYLSGKALYGDKAGLYAAVIFFTLPLVSFNSLFITTDAPLLFFWSLAIYLTINLKRMAAAWWLLALVVGCGLLSKYTMLFWILGFALYHLWRKTPAAYWVAGKTWVAISATVLLVMPNLLWNWQHDFISFQHTSEISKLQGQLFHPLRLLEFVAGQALVFGPLAFYALLVGMKFLHVHSDADKLMLSMLLPLLLVMMIQALLAKANINWAAPVYVAASILLASQLARTQQRHWLRAIVSVNLLIASLFYTYPHIQKMLQIEATIKNTPFHRLAGWPELFRSIPQVVNPAAQQVWLSDSRLVLSYLHYYLPLAGDRAALHLLSFNPDGHVRHQFDLQHDLDQSQYNSFVFVSEAERDLTACFTTSEKIGQLQYKVYPSLTRHLYFYHLAGFKGYAYCHE